MLSVKKVMNMLTEQGFINGWSWGRQDASLYDDTPPLWEKVIKVKQVPDSVLHIGNEIYGDKAMLYFYCTHEHEAKQIVDVLRNAGGNPSFRWCPDSNSRFDLRVSYFKGCRWWE